MFCLQGMRKVRYHETRSNPRRTKTQLRCVWKDVSPYEEQGSARKKVSTVTIIGTVCMACGELVAR